MFLRRFFAAVLVIATASPFVHAQDDPALERLNNSPRHHEWLTVEGDGREVQAFVVYPEVSEKAHAVLVIHENRGLTDWVRGVADQLAEHGYIAVAPDLLSGKAPGGGKTSDFDDRNAARDALYEIDDEQIAADIDAVAAYARGIAAADGTLSVAGFCWGGRQTFLMATRDAELKAACVFYGTPPETEEEYAAIECPVYGFYGGRDNRVNATIPDSEAAMKAAEKFYEPIIYDGAGHGFMRAGETADEGDANRTAMNQGWARWLKILEGEE